MTTFKKLNGRLLICVFL